MLNCTPFEDGYDFVPDQLNINIGTGGAALTGKWVNLANFDRAYCLILNPAGSDGDDIVITPLQASSSTGTGSKALTFSKMWLKFKSGSLTNVVGTWTQIDLTTPSSALNFASVVGTKLTSNNGVPVANTADMALETIENVVLVEFRKDSMDGANGFSWISMTIPILTVAATKTINTHWILKGNAYAEAIPITSLA